MNELITIIGFIMIALLSSGFKAGDSVYHKFNDEIGTVINVEEDGKVLVEWNYVDIELPLELINLTEERKK